jgi:hypothetical protein
VRKERRRAARQTFENSRDPENLLSVFRGFRAGGRMLTIAQRLDNSCAAGANAYHIPISAFRIFGIMQRSPLASSPRWEYNPRLVNQ